MSTTNTLTDLVLIDSQSGKKVAGTTTPFILALKIGENLFESILRVANDAGINAASMSGLGAIDDVTLAYYHLDKKEYQTKLFKGTYELVSLNGNIALLDGKRFLHIHGAIGNDEYQVFGGHFMDAIVGPSAEITIIPMQGKINRAYDDCTGLKIMCPSPSDRGSDLSN